MSEKNLEVSGKSVEEAIEKGLLELGRTRDQVKIEVVREGSRGLLGLRSEEAIVRLTVPEIETPAVIPPAPAAAPQTPVAAAEAVGAEDAAGMAKEVLENLVRGMGLRAHVQVQPDASAEEPNAFVLNIVGDDLGVLIGRRGETLRDLEYLTRLLVSHKAGRQPKLVVDVEGYRTRRERVLRELAKRMAERVQSNRQPITLEAMPPNERRIVHITLRDHPSVTTHSIGEGDHRRVMILPK